MIPVSKKLRKMGRNPVHVNNSSMKLPKVSIITIVRNGDKTIRRTIDSVLGQSYENIEYIIVDGGSTDNTLEIIKEYCDKIAIRISEPDQGISDAFNKGVVLSSGDIIGFINADDWLESDVVQDVVDNIDNTEKPIIVHGMIQYWSNEKREYCVAGNHDLLELDMTINHPTVFATTICYQKFGMFRLEYKCAMDYEWLLRAQVAGVEFIYLPRIMANMQLGGVSNRMWRQAIIEIGHAKCQHLNRRLSANFYCLTQIMKGSVMRIMLRMRLGRAIEFYRNNLSLVNKIKNNDAH